MGQTANKPGRAVGNLLGSPSDNMSLESAGPPEDPNRPLTSEDRSQTPGNAGQNQYDTGGYVKNVIQGVGNDWSKWGKQFGHWAEKNIPGQEQGLADMTDRQALDHMVNHGKGRQLLPALKELAAPGPAAPPRQAAPPEALAPVPEGAAAGGAPATVAGPIERDFPMYGTGTAATPAHDVALVSPKTSGMLNDANTAGVATAGQMEDNLHTQSIVDQAMANQHGMSADERALDARNLAAEQATSANDRLRGIDQDARNLANYHEDPNRFYESRSTGQKVAGLLGVILGGFAQGMHGGANAALEQINRAQDLDLQAQRSAYLANKDSLKAKESAYGMAMEKYKNAFEAQNVVRMAQLDRNIADTEKMAAQHRGTAAENDALQAIQIFREKKAEIYNATHKYVQAQAAQGPNMGDLRKEYMKYYNSTLENVHKGAEGATPPLDFSDWVRPLLGGSVRAPNGPANAAHASKDKDGTIVNTNEGPKRALSTDSGQEYQQRMQGADKVQSALAEAQKILNKSVRTPSDIAKFDGLMVEAKTGYVQQEGFKRTPSDTETHQLEQMFPIGGANNTAVFKGNAARLEQSMKISKESREQAKKTYLKTEDDAPKVYTPKTGSEVK